MIAIGRIPRRLRMFLHAVRDRFTPPAFRRFWSLVLALTVARVSTISRRVKFGLLAVWCGWIAVGDPNAGGLRRPR